VTGVRRRWPAPDPRRAAWGLLLVPLVLFAPAVLGRRAFFQRDILFYWGPHLENAVRALAEGAWPTWTSHVAFGRPLLADPNFQLLYPPTWLNLLMQPATYYTVFVVAHCWAAAVGTMLLARACGSSAGAGALAGVLFASSGPLLSSVNLFHHFAGAAWMPWVLWLLLRALARPSTPSALVLGAAGGGQALAGSADLLVLTAAAAILYALLHVSADGAQRRERLAVCARTGAIAAGFAVLVSAVQWLPAWYLLGGASRGLQDLAVRTTWSVHPASLADVLVPRLVAAMPWRADIRVELFDGRQPLFESLYLGIASLPLVALALTGRAQPVRRWALLAGGFFVLGALGRHTPAYAALAAVPPLSLLRYPSKFMLGAALFWALLAARGWDVWTAEWTGAQRRRGLMVAAIGGGVACAAAAGAIALWRSPASLAPWTDAADLGAAAAGGLRTRAAAAVMLAAAAALLAARAARPAAAARLGAAAAVLAACDVVWAGRRVNALGPTELWRYRPPAAASILSRAPEARLYVRQESADQLNDWLVRGTGGWDSPEGWAVGSLDLLVPPIAARWNIGGSYDGDFTGLGSPALATFSLVLPRLAGHPLALKLLQVAAVTHVTSLRERPLPGLREVAAIPSAFVHPVRVFEVPDPLPRVYVVGAARTASTYNEAMAAIADAQFDPRRSVVLPEGAAVHDEADGFQGTARVTSRQADHLVVDAQLAGPGWLVVAEAYEAGWRAHLDGAPAPVLSANGLFRAVAMPAGRHRVEMSYRPRGLRAGLGLSAAAALLGLAAAARHRRSASPARERTEPRELARLGEAAR
jgi:hypothetical protein